MLPLVDSPHRALCSGLGAAYLSGDPVAVPPRRRPGWATASAGTLLGLLALLPLLGPEAGATQAAARVAAVRLTEARPAARISQASSTGPRHAPWHDPISLLPPESLQRTATTHQSSPVRLSLGGAATPPHPSPPATPEWAAWVPWVGGWGAVAVLGVAGQTGKGQDRTETSRPAVRLGLLLTLAPALAVVLSTSDAVAAGLDLVGEQAPPLLEVLQKAALKAVGGGKAGAAAAVLQVLSLMWLRTAMNYQYRFGGEMVGTVKKLYGEGGLPRLYQGLPYALVQGPLSRFGDTAATVGVMAVFASAGQGLGIPIAAQTLVASGAAGAWRIVLTPIDTIKTTVQVNGPQGIEVLKARVATEGLGVMYNGAVATAVATALGHYPWYLVYNTLVVTIPSAQILHESPALVFLDPRVVDLMRSAVIGFCASAASDCISNSARVLKTKRQTYPEAISYPQALSLVLEQDGLRGLLGRGLRTRLVCNGMQGVLFTVLWRYLQQVWHV